ncbi:MAG TPA: PqqD family peptide modification chaperone [Anaerolineae bacterium]|nr:PqqD family peptide modification chaperone [Anaerolineae bacterium]
MEADLNWLDRQIALRDDVAYRKVGDSVYVYALRTGETSKLTGVGELIWGHLTRQTPLREIAASLSDQFAVPLAQVAQDVCKFVRSLYDRSIVTADGETGGVRRSFREATRWQPELVITEVKRQRVPFRVDFETTYACNLDCVYCYTAKDNHRVLNTSEVQSILDQLAEAGTLFLCFTGGEPFARRDLEQLIRLAHERRFAILVLTNATLITPAYADLLARWCTVQVSLHGARPSTHDAFTAVNGSFRRACRGIEYLAQAGANVYVIFNATYHNVREEDALRRLCEQWQVGFALNVHLLPNVNGSLAPLDYRISDDWVLDLARQGKLVRRRSVCTAATTKARISPFGDVYPCELVRRSFGNLREQAFEDIWRGAELEAFRASEFFCTPEACHACAWSDYCRRCPALAEMEDGNPNSPSSEACRVARLCAEAKQETYALERQPA